MASETCLSKLIQPDDSVIENVYGIIDSKIQYLDHQTNGLVRPLMQAPSFDKEVVGATKSDSSCFLEDAEKMFSHFEQQSRRKKILLCLRTLLDDDNALLALALLSDNTLFEFDTQEIAFILDKKTDKQAA